MCAFLNEYFSVHFLFYFFLVVNSFFFLVNKNSGTCFFVVFFYFFSPIHQYSAYMSQNAISSTVPDVRSGAPEGGATTRHRAWMFTSFSPDKPDFPCRYLVFQQERCPDTDRLHWQGYCVFNDSIPFGRVQRHLPGAHWEPRRGTHEEARTYCTKNRTRVDGPYERGTPPKQGARSDLDALCAAVAAGATDRVLAVDMPETIIKYHRGISALRMSLVIPRDHKTRCLVLWGPAGCGKSRWAHKGFPTAYHKDPSSWWDGYCGHDVVIIDEFYGQLSLSYMLKLLDRYPCQFEVKGGYVMFRAKLVIITSNTDPLEWYRGLSEKVDRQGRERPVIWQPQFFRRIEHVYRYTDGHWERNMGEWDSVNYQRCSLPDAAAIAQLLAPEEAQRDVLEPVDDGSEPLTQ